MKLMILKFLIPKSYDFSVFVSHTSKIEKEKALQKAADKAIKSQRQVIEAATA